MVLDLWRDDRSTPRSLFDDVWGALDDINRYGSNRRPTYSAMSAACDIAETDDSFVLTFDVPGLKKEDINIEVTSGRQLTISGERKHEDETHHANSYRIERSFGKFRRSFDLPDGVNVDLVSASYENGVLKVAVPKGEAGKTKKIEIGEPGKGFFKKLTSKSEPKVVNS